MPMQKACSRRPFFSSKLFRRIFFAERHALKPRLPPQCMPERTRRKRDYASLEGLAKPVQRARC
jgi:hypothetical protein